MAIKVYTEIINPFPGSNCATVMHFIYFTYDVLYVVFIYPAIPLS